MSRFPGVGSLSLGLGYWVLSLGTWVVLWMKGKERTLDNRGQQLDDLDGGGA